MRTRWWHDLISDWIWSGRDSGQTLHGEGENLFSSCLPQHFPGLPCCWRFGKEAWVGSHSQVRLLIIPACSSGAGGGGTQSFSGAACVTAGVTCQGHGPDLSPACSVLGCPGDTERSRGIWACVSQLWQSACAKAPQGDPLGPSLCGAQVGPGLWPFLFAC